MTSSNSTRPQGPRFPRLVHVEHSRRETIHAFGYYWAIRGGFNNVTGRKNWIFVNNDIDSPDKFTFSVYNGRAFTGRIRFLGRK